MKEKLCLIAILAGTLASCSTSRPQSPAPAEPELNAVSATLWSGRTELFMEHPELVRGETAGFAVHLTDLVTYRPLAEGLATLEFENAGKVTRFESNRPSRPGIFRVDVRLDAAGRYRAVLKVQAPKLEDRHDLGEMIVHESKAAALAQTEAESPAEGIRFLKEQQWASEFATEVAAPRKIEESLQVPAVVRVRGGGEGSAISPVRGQLLNVHRLPIPGQRVRQGEVIAAVIPFTSSPQDLAGLKLELSQAETDMAQSRRLRERLEGLLADRAIPARRVEEVKADEARAQARIQAAQERLAQFERTRSGTDGQGEGVGSFEVRAPLTGIVTTLSAVTGGSVEAGQEILHIIDIDQVWVAAEVPESESEVLRTLKRAELQTGSLSIDIPGKRGRIERIGNVVDPESRRIAVILEVSNEDGALRIGQSLFARLGKGKAEALVSVPVSAIVDDGGRPVVFVQRDGESFERRPVRTGAAAGNYVQVVEGLKAGDRVVSRGAYLVRLAALSTQIPAHGHVH
ncbi:MAG: efflux transporter, family, subunit [Acidobacteria bacterium]|nr:efflux transporter, family, subunit [Acidobacteriota bacterium]